MNLKFALPFLSFLALFGAFEKVSAHQNAPLLLPESNLPNHIIQGELKNEHGQKVGTFSWTVGKDEEVTVEMIYQDADSSTKSLSPSSKNNEDREELRAVDEQVLITDAASVRLIDFSAHDGKLYFIAQIYTSTLDGVKTLSAFSGCDNCTKIEVPLVSYMKDTHPFALVESVPTEVMFDATHERVWTLSLVWTE